MSTAKDTKREEIEVIKAKIQESKSIVIVDYKGISVAKVTELRNKFRAVNVEYKVLKNRLVKIAFNELGVTCMDKDLEGTTAFAFAKADALAPAKILADAVTTIKTLKIKSGFMDNAYLSSDDVNVLSKIPSKEILLAQLLGLLQSGLSGLARAISQIAEQKAE